MANHVRSHIAGVVLDRSTRFTLVEFSKETASPTNTGQFIAALDIGTNAAQATTEPRKSAVTR